MPPEYFSHSLPIVQIKGKKELKNEVEKSRYERDSAWESCHIVTVK